jgi:hypothetical protein
MHSAVAGGRACSDYFAPRRYAISGIIETPSRAEEPPSAGRGLVVGRMALEAQLEEVLMMSWTKVEAAQQEVGEFLGEVAGPAMQSGSPRKNSAASSSDVGIMARAPPCRAMTVTPPRQRSQVFRSGPARCYDASPTCRRT